MGDRYGNPKKVATSKQRLYEYTAGATCEKCGSGGRTGFQCRKSQVPKANIIQPSYLVSPPHQQLLLHWDHSSTHETPLSFMTQHPLEDLSTDIRDASLQQFLPNDAPIKTHPISYHSSSLLSPIRVEKNVALSTPLVILATTHATTPLRTSSSCPPRILPCSTSPPIYIIRTSSSSSLSSSCCPPTPPRPRSLGQDRPSTSSFRSVTEYDQQSEVGILSVPNYRDLPPSDSS